jgi:hypothetical protein
MQNTKGGKCAKDITTDHCWGKSRLSRYVPDGAGWISVARFRKGFPAGFDQKNFNAVFYRNLRILPDGQSLSFAGENDSGKPVHG